MPGLVETLYAELAQALGLTALPPDAGGGVTLSVGETSSVILFGTEPDTLLVVSPVAPLSKQADYATTLWLLRRNFYDSPIEPFRVASDTEGNLILWGRLPLPGLTGAALAAVIDAVAAEADLIRQEVATDEVAEAAG